MKSTIHVKTTEELVGIIAGLMQNGVIFEVEGTEGRWMITLLGV